MPLNRRSGKHGELLSDDGCFEGARPVKPAQGRQHLSVEMGRSMEDGTVDPVGDRSTQRLAEQQVDQGGRIDHQMRSAQRPAPPPRGQKSPASSLSASRAASTSS